MLIALSVLAYLAIGVVVGGVVYTVGEECPSNETLLTATLFWPFYLLRISVRGIGRLLLNVVVKIGELIFAMKDRRAQARKR